MTIAYYRRDKEYQKSTKVYKKWIYTVNGKNIRRLKDPKFEARDEDYLYI